MAVEWFFLKDDTEKGPIPSSRLKAYVSEGVFLPSTPIRRTTESETSNWIRAGEIKGLFQGQTKTSLGSPICPSCGRVLSQGVCQKCSPAPPPLPSPKMEPSDEPSSLVKKYWFHQRENLANIFGPLTRDELVEKLNAGELAWDYYVLEASGEWIDTPKYCSNADWAPIRSIVSPIPSESKKAKGGSKHRILYWIGAFLVFSILGKIVGGSERNATCPVCGCSFHIPDLRDRGGYLMFRVEYRCPDCLLRFPAAVFYNYQDGTVRREEEKLNREVLEVFDIQ